MYVNVCISTPPSAYNELTCTIGKVVFELWADNSTYGNDSIKVKPSARLVFPTPIAVEVHRAILYGEKCHTDMYIRQCLQ